MKHVALIAVVLGLLGVVMGAFGAHGLKTLLAPERLDVWKTAVSYQMYHVPVLLAIAWLNSAPLEKFFNLAASSFISGILVFSGSLYLLVLLDMPVMGMVTPVGGVLLIIGWLFLLLGIVKAPPGAGER